MCRLPLPDLPPHRPADARKREAARRRTPDHSDSRFEPAPCFPKRVRAIRTCRIEQWPGFMAALKKNGSG